MGFRFRKAIKLFPGVRLNLSKSGVSTTIGVRGASVNIGKSGSRATVGLPGTGISYSEKLSGPVARDNDPQQSLGQETDPSKSRSGLLWLLVIVVIGVVAFELLGK